jgi:hypothetical protein
MITPPLQAATQYRAIVARLPLPAADKTRLCDAATRVQAEAWTHGYARGQRRRGGRLWPTS